MKVSGVVDFQYLGPKYDYLKVGEWLVTDPDTNTGKVYTHQEFINKFEKL